jgi:DNA-binding transcriptional ArsR family regulator
VWLTAPTIPSFALSSDYSYFVSDTAPDEYPATDTDLPSQDQVKAAVTAFSMLAEPTRLQLLWLVSAEELDVSSLAGRLDTNVSVVSAHLAKLRLAGLVDTRRAGRHVLYRARDVHVRSLIAEALFHADHQVSRIADHD